MVGIAMAESHDLDYYEGRMQAFKHSDEERLDLCDEILRKYRDLQEEHANLKNDYASERDVRRNYQKSVDQMQKQVSDGQQEMASNSFVLALIDGDGVIFQDAFLQAAAGNGGSEAAFRLNGAIREHIASIYNSSDSWPIMVQIYVSLDKLAQKLANVGLLSHQQSLRTFAQCFSINQPLFNIIDVGQGKERADHKIKEMLRTFSNNPTCRHIIFGGCHDAGYLLNLDQYKHNASKAERITLLESTPVYRGFANLPNFHRTRFVDVFKSEPLPEYPHAPLRAMSNRTNSPADSPKPAAAVMNLSTPAHSSPTTTALSLAQSDASDSSWATVGKTGVTANGYIDIAPAAKKDLKKKYVYYNKDGERLDEPLPPRDRTAAESLERRMEKAGRNLCNHWHLGNGACTSGRYCRHQHEPKLTTSELNALRYKTRSLACKNRDCINFNCYLGHQCAFERDQGHCPYPNTCNLRHTHGMDRVKYERWDEQGNREGP